MTEGSSTEAQPAHPSADNKPEKKNQKRGSQGAWLASVLAIIAMLVAAWLYVQLTDLRNQIKSIQSELKETTAWELDIRELVSAVEQQEYELDLHQQQLEQVRALMQDRLKSLRQTMVPSSQDWALMEVEYLLRLANQRLQFASDVPTAIALLDSADDILLDLNDPGLLSVREAIADDKAALQALPTLDRDGIIIELAALSEQLSALPLKQYEYAAREEKTDERVAREEEMIDAPASDEEEGSLFDDWDDINDWDEIQEKIAEVSESAWQAAWQQLQNIIVVRRHDEPTGTYGLPSETFLVEQNLYLVLEQAQWAVLKGQPVIYQMNVSKAREWVAAYSEPDDDATRAFIKQLDWLAEQPIVLQLPDVSDLLDALEQAVQQSS